MPKAYAVVTYRSVSDPEKLAAYAKLAGPAVAPFGARFLARGNAAVAVNRGLKSAPSLSNIRAWRRRRPHMTPAYAEALKALGDGAVRDLRIVEGVE